MSKKCVVRRNSEGIPEMVLVKNPNISSINDRTDSGLGVSGVNFQINNIDSESPVVSIPGEILKEVQNRLMQTGLVKKINTVTNDELVNYLKSKTADYISKQVVAFHGSPHSFDKFKTDKIGTGEGNQAFGWGLYFTDLRSIAEHYAKMYNENSIFSITLNGIEDLSTYSKKVISSAILRATNSYQRMLQSSGELMDELDLAMESIEDDIENNNFDEEGLKYDNITKVVIYSRDEAIKALQELKNVKEDDFLIPKGNLYKVSLHKGKIPSNAILLSHAYYDKPKKGELGFFAAKHTDIGLNDYGDKRTYLIPKKDAKIIDIRTSKEYLEKNGLINEPIPNVKIDGKPFTYADHWADEGTLANDGWYYNQKRVLQDLKEKGVEVDIIHYLDEDSTVEEQWQIVNENSVDFFEKQPEQYTWLEWDKPMSDKALELFQKFNKEQGVKLSEPTEPISKEDRITVGQMYKWISDKIGQKEASLFLLENGIDGIKYPAESISRGATSDNARGFNYVVFDENAVIIEKHLKFQKTSDLAVGGFYDRSTKEIYLNKDNSNILETSIHEFGHAYLDWLKDYYPDHLIAGKTLLDVNKTEAKSYIDYVKTTQSNLDESSDEFKEEVLAQIIGDNGAKLINSKSNNNIAQWLNDLWEMFKNIIGLTDYTAQDIVNMSLQDFANAVNSDMINNNISKYSISILESFDFKNLRGKQVKKETIKQYLNKQGIKQIEKDIINSVLDQEDFNNKFNYDIFEKAVKLQIMPLSKIDSDTYSDYGADNINLEYDKAKTIIYNTPVNHNINEGYHFTYEHELYKQANTENTEIKIVSSDKHFGPVTLLLDKNGVELYRKEGDYSLSAMRAYYGNQYATTKELTQGGFGHTRVWLKDDAYIIAEIQSDIFQKNNIKNDLKGSDLNTKQFIASSKFFELRLIRESIKDAATKGYDKVRIPLPFTLSTIEGHYNSDKNVSYNGEVEDLNIGDEVNINNKNYTIIKNIDYKKFNVTPTEKIIKGNINDVAAYIADLKIKDFYYDIEDKEYNLEEFISILFDSGYNETEIKAIKNIFKNNNKDVIDIEKQIENIKTTLQEIIKDNLIEYMDEYDYVDSDINHFIIHNGEYYYTTDPHLEYIDFDSENNYNINHLLPSHRSVAMRYGKLGDLLKQERGDDNFDIIEDDNGYPWYETKIKDSDRNESIKAFQIVPEHILNMKYDDELTNSLNTAIEMKNEEEATDQQIKNETGWEYNKITGVWEYEINNGQFVQEEFYKLQDNSLGKNKTSETDLKNIWEHPELYEIFPDLKKAKIIFTDINNIDVNINIGTINENDIDNLITNIEKLSIKALSDGEYFKLKDLLKSKKGTRLSEEQEQYLENTLDSDLRYVLYDILKGHSLMSSIARLIERNTYEGNVLISKDNILNIANKELPLLLKEDIFRRNIKITEANAMLSYTDNNPIFKINKNIGIDLANKEMTHEIQHYIQDYFDEGLGGNQYEYPLADIKRRMLEIVDIKISKSNNTDDIKYLQKKKKEYEKTDPRILRKIYYNNLIGEVQARMVANRYDYDSEDRKILFSNNIDVNSLDIIDKYIHDNSFIPSQLYENLKNEPFIGEEEALEIYKPMVYSKEASYINSINLNEC